MRTKQGAIGKDFGKVMNQIETIKEKLEGIESNAAAVEITFSTNRIMTQDLSKWLNERMTEIMTDASAIRDILFRQSESEE